MAHLDGLTSEQILNEYGNDPIENLCLSPQVEQGLKERGITTIGVLYKTPSEYLISIPALWRVQYIRIIVALRDAYSLHYPPDNLPQQ